jgi:non-ribosomal peptide synthetase component F
VHQLVETQVKVRPNDVAVTAWDGDFTYDELYNYSLRLAHHLVALGAGPDRAVCLCMDKSKWAIVSLLAILQSGSAITPLGTRHPLDRIDTIVAQAKSSLILVDSSQRERLVGIASMSDVNLVTVDVHILDGLPL